MELLFPLLIVALLVPMFLGMRRQRKEVTKQTEMQDSLTIGDHVTTTSGVYGTIVALDPTTVDLEIAEDVVTTWLRIAIREVRTGDGEFDVLPEAAEREVLPPTPERGVEETAVDTERRLNRE